jgi:hypothetical protein
VLFIVIEVYICDPPSQNQSHGQDFKKLNNYTVLETLMKASKICKNFDSITNIAKDI